MQSARGVRRKVALQCRSDGQEKALLLGGQESLRMWWPGRDGDGGPGLVILPDVPGR